MFMEKYLLMVIYTNLFIAVIHSLCVLCYMKKDPNKLSQNIVALLNQKLTFVVRVKLMFYQFVEGFGSPYTYILAGIAYFIF